MASLTYQLIVEPRVHCNISDMTQLPIDINEFQYHDSKTYTYSDNVFCCILMFVCPRNAPSIANPVNYDKIKLHKHITCTPNRPVCIYIATYYHKEYFDLEIHKNCPTKIYITATR